MSGKPVLWTCLSLMCLSGLSAAGQSQESTCWQLPKQCYAMEIDYKGLKIAMAGVEAGGRLVTIEDIAGPDRRHEMLCIERVASHDISCSHYYLCKPRAAGPLRMDTDTTDALEIRWTAEAAVPVREVQLRHDVDALRSRIEARRWVTVPVTFRHWRSAASGAPQCWLDIEGG